MNEATFTPGPWKVERLIQARATQTVITAMDPTDGPGDPPWELATVWPRVGYDDDQSPANARLMASAPDLLSALRDCIDVMENDLRRLTCIQPELRVARAAYAKATTGEFTP